MLLIILINISKIDIQHQNKTKDDSILLIENSFSSYINNITDCPIIYFDVKNISYSYSKDYGLIEVKYLIFFFDSNFNDIKPSNLALLYNLSIFCDIYIYKTNENIYSVSNIYENKYFFCIEYIQTKEHVNFGIKIYRKNDIDLNIEYDQQFFFTDRLIKIYKSSTLENNNKFNMNHIYGNYKKLLKKIIIYKEKNIIFKENLNLKTSFMNPPTCILKRDIAQVEGKWYFNNIYQSYFCFCRGESCINIIALNIYNFQSCKYFLFLSVIDNSRFLYPKTHYLLSDFFDEKIESSEAFPLFKEMIRRNFSAHYITMSSIIFNQFCLNNNKCINESQIIFGVNRINGDILEKYLELFLKLKVVIAAEKFNCIDNLFFNIEYITYIFLGHGVTYIKSYLYKNYLSPKIYNKILLPSCKKIINLALESGWKNEDIVKVGYPKWDSYEIFPNDTFSNKTSKDSERSIFLMFTWRKIKKGKNMSTLYFDNIKNILNDKKINTQLNINNIKIFFCFHHTLQQKRIIKVNKENIKFVRQNDISKLLKNSSLIITDFSSILFDAIVQKKPLILFLPDALDPDLKDIYVEEYYETIQKIKNGEINLYEVFYDLDQVINKIIYYIKNNFALEKEKLEFYKQFDLKNEGNTLDLIKYVKSLV